MFAELSEGSIEVIHELLSAVVLGYVADVKLALTLIVALERLLGGFVGTQNFSSRLGGLSFLCWCLLCEIA